MRIGHADRRVVRQIDDASVILAEAHLARRDSIPALVTPRISPAFSGMPVPGMKLPGRANTPFMPVRAFGAPQTTETGTLAGIDRADAQAVGVRVLHRLDDVGDAERRQRRTGSPRLELQSDAGQRVGDAASQPRCRDGRAATRG